MTEEMTDVPVCKNCGSSSVVKFGKYKNTQLYWCKSCERKFKGDDALFHMKVSPELISTALSMYYSGSSISDIRNHIKQEHGGYYPSKHVIFEWVDKFTSVAAKQFRDVCPKIREHSRKPDEMYDLIEQTGLEPRLELFARERDRKGWDCIGASVNSGEDIRVSLAEMIAGVEE